MSEFLTKIRSLVDRGDFLVTDHALKALVDDNITFETALAALELGTAIEEYPNYHKGPAVLVFTQGPDTRILHFLWGIPAEHDRPATLITAYVPDRKKWEDDLKTRKKK